jgi:carboxymethylenebutenolidase
MMSAGLLQQKINLEVSDGTKMDAYAARPDDKDVHAGIMVLQEAFGVNAHIRNVTDRLAREGYVAIAPELFHRTAPGFEGDYNNFNTVMPHTSAMKPEGVAADLKACFQWLQEQKSVQADHNFCVGYCMGGRIAFAANSILPLRAAVSYYGGGIAPGSLDRVSSLHGPMLFFWGELDKHIPPEQRKAVIDALKANHKTYVNVEFSDADHGFFCDERKAYQPRAARQSWALMMEFLRSF